MEDLCKPVKVGGDGVHVHQIRVVLAGWNLLCYSLRKMYCLKVSPRLTRYGGRLLGFGCPRTKVVQEIFFWPISAIHTLRSS